MTRVHRKIAEEFARNDRVIAGGLCRIRLTKPVYCQAKFDRAYSECRGSAYLTSREASGRVETDFSSSTVHLSDLQKIIPSRVGRAIEKLQHSSRLYACN